MIEYEVRHIGCEWVGVRPGGLNRYVDSLAMAQTLAGSDVWVQVLGPAAPGQPAYIECVGSRDSSVLARLSAIARYKPQRVVQRGETVLDVHFALYALPIVLRRRKPLGPLVVHFHGPWALESFAAKKTWWSIQVRRRLELLVYRRADALIVLSNAFAEILTRTYGIAADKVYVVPPGVDLAKFKPSTSNQDPGHFDATLGRFTVLAVRRLEARMGLDVLIRAWAIAQIPGGRLVIAGEGSLRGALESLIGALGVEGSVTLLGRVADDDLVELYESASCCVVPSIALEGYGLVVLEALACGTPSIVSDVGGLPSGLVGLDESLVVPANDAGALAQRLQSASRGCLPNSSSCREHAENFSWTNCSLLHNEVYEKVRRDIRVRG